MPSSRLTGVIVLCLSKTFYPLLSTGPIQPRETGNRPDMFEKVIART